MRRKRASNFPRISRQILPGRIQVKLPYFTSFPINVNEVATQAEYRFSLTSAFDPEITGTGAQPRGFDQYSTLYSNYLVKGVAFKILLRPSSDSAAPALTMLVGVTAGPEDFSAQNFANVTDYMEYPQSKYHRVRTTTRNASQPSENAAYNSRANFFKGYFSNRALNRYYGGRGIQAASATGTEFTWPTDFSAAVNADPLAENELVVWAASLPQDGSASLPTLPYINVDCHLTYYVEFFNPVFPAAS